MRRAFILALLILPSCAPSSGGPSLARRPIESRDLAEPVAVESAPVATDPELAAQIDGLVNRARVGERDFFALLPRAQAAASAAGTQGSESWITAQQLLTALEGAREATSNALTRLDALLAARVLAGNDAGLAELQSAQRDVGALSEQQQQRFDQLQARINR